MTLKELIAELRSQLDDSAEPFLWSDAELTGYLNDAERQACERALLIYDDAPSALTKLTLKTGRARYPINPLILSVERVVPELAANDRFICQRTLDWLDENLGRWQEQTGKPSHFVDLVRTLLFVGIPSVDENVILTVYRLPLEPMEGNDDEPEIQPQHHLRLMNWAMHRAYLKRDSDTFDKNRAALHDSLFAADFGMRDNANVMRLKRRKRDTTVRFRELG